MLAGGEGGLGRGGAGGFGGVLAPVSLSTIFTVAVDFVRVTPAGVGLLSTTVNVSSASDVLSSTIVTGIVFDVWPGANVSVPGASVKSVPSVAPGKLAPLRPSYCTVTVCAVEPARVTVERWPCPRPRW